MTAAILGIGTAVPARSIAQEAALAMARYISSPDQARERVLPILYRRTNVRRRGSVLLDEEVNGDISRAQSYFVPASGPLDQGPGTESRLDRYAVHAPALAAEAALAALGDGGLDPSAVTHLITVSCTGFMAPGLDAALIRGIGISPLVQRTHVGFMGCHGAINGLRVAKAFAEADPRAVVLVVAVELCSLHFHYGSNPEQMVANALFADGAAGVVVGTDATKPSLESFGSCMVPESEDAMTWRIGDHGFAMSLSARVPDLLRAHLRGWIDPWLESRGLTRRDIRGWAVHPGGPRIVGTVEEVLDLSPKMTEPSRAVLAAHGNMSSPTVLFILRELMRQEVERPYVALGFGPGLAAEGMLVR